MQVVKKILSNYAPQKENLLFILHDIQQKSNNFIPEESIPLVAEYLNLTIGYLEGIIGYYSMLSREKRTRYVIRYCVSPVCLTKGIEEILEFLRKYLKISKDNISDDKLFTLEESSCLGLCDKAPALMINDEEFGDLTIDKIKTIIEEKRRQK